MLRLKSENPRSGSSAGRVLATQSRDLHCHPLATTDVVTIEMERDEDTQSIVTYVKELHDMSTFGDTEREALGRTEEMIRGYLASMEDRGKQIPLANARLAELKALIKTSNDVC